MKESTKVELGSEHIKYVKNPYCFAGGVKVGMSSAMCQDIIECLTKVKKIV